MKTQGKAKEKFTDIERIDKYENVQQMQGRKGIKSV